MIGLSAGTPDNRVVLADDVLAKIEAGQSAEFDNCTIVGLLDLSTSRIDGSVHFNHTIFRDPVSFYSTIFNNDAYFMSSTFDHDVDLVYSAFNGTAFFVHSKFNRGAYFRSSKFNSTADFGYSAFNGAADFRSSKFNSTANFKFSKFKGTADFEYSEFNGIDYFWASEFNHEANFGSSAFNDTADFRASKFNSTANFEYSIFNGEANFEYLTFNGTAGFWASEFNRDAYLGFSKFNGTADFRLSKFNRDAHLGSSKFNGTADFRLSKFNGTADFGYSEFDGDAKFDGSKFKGTANFKESFIYAISFNSSNFNNFVDFSDIFISKNGKIYLIKAEFDEIYIDWGIAKSKLVLELQKRISLYKKLRESYLQADNQYDANDCYYQLKKAQFEQLDDWDAKLLDILARYSYGYGFKPFYPVSLSVITIILFGIMFWMRGVDRPLFFSFDVFLSGTGKLLVDTPKLPEGSNASIRRLFDIERIFGLLFFTLTLITFANTIGK